MFRGASSVRRFYIEISRFVRSGAFAHSSQPVRHRTPVASSCSRQTVRFYGADSTGQKTNLHRPLWLQTFKDLINFPPCTHEIRDLRDPATSGPLFKESVCLHGYIASRHDLSKKLSFAQLHSKDLSHNIQVISAASLADGTSNVAHLKLKDITEHSPVAVRGFLKQRKPPKSSTLGGLEIIQDVELELHDIQLLNEFPKDILAEEDTNYAPEQRHLQLRMIKDARDAVQFRSRVIQHCRSWFEKQRFLEVETPLLFKSTPEGAREFVVPTRKPGLAYALPQSPQQYKQILMASGIPRYFQVARCFRDEDLRADRQPEFTQLDLEMAFASGEDVMRLMEQFIRSLVTSGHWAGVTEGAVKASFPRLTYEEAMSRYGSDKPDLRQGMEIRRIGHLLPADLITKITPLNDPIVEVLRLHVSDDAKETGQFVTSFMGSADAGVFNSNPHGQPGIFIYDPRKPLQGLSAFGFEATERLEDELTLEEGDLIVLQARPNAPFSGGSTPLGNLRLALHRAAVKAGLVDAPAGFKFLWITHFPLFSPVNDSDPGQGGAAGICSTHHPFTSPRTAEDVDLLLTDPLKVRADHYDIVVNGVELGGGSRRIHDARVQEFVLRDILKMSDERVEHFRHLLDVLNAGCPPHAGIALGLDRLIAVMLGKESIRDVIAFPKSSKGEDMLVKSPSPLTKSQLDTYHLRLKGD